MDTNFPIKRRGRADIEEEIQPYADYIEETILERSQKEISLLRRVGVHRGRRYRVEDTIGKDPLYRSCSDPIP